MLTGEQITAFEDDGFVKIEEAFPRALADHCRDLLWKQTGCDPDDPATWTRPVIRIDGRGDAPFRQAATTPRLHEAFDQLAGEGRWRPRLGLGTFPIRFPHPDDPGDAGWHVEGSYLNEAGTGYRLNLRSRGRALLMLFLFSEVGPLDAPTLVKAGSHLDVAPVLAEAGDDGRDFFAFAADLDARGLLDNQDRATIPCTGEPGDVYLVHPFLVHSAQPHRGTRPKFMAQPPLDPAGELELDRADGAYSPVERAVRRALTEA